jgi:hypothetical protein
MTVDREDHCRKSRLITTPELIITVKLPRMSVVTNGGPPVLLK